MAKDSTTLVDSTTSVDTTSAVDSTVPMVSTMPVCRSKLAQLSVETAVLISAWGSFCHQRPKLCPNWILIEP